MECAVHPEAVAERTCAACNEPSCNLCLTYDVEGEPVCTACGQRTLDRCEIFGESLVAFIAVGYLAALALGYVVFRAQFFIGGLAAVVAIALGRALQLMLRLPVVARHTPQAPGSR